MIFHPQNVIKTNGSFTFWGDLNAIAHPCLNKNIIKEFWHSFTFQSSTLNISESEEFIFLLGNAKPLSLDGYDYSINIEPCGVCVCAENEKDLIRGFMAPSPSPSSCPRSTPTAPKSASRMRSRVCISTVPRWFIPLSFCFSISVFRWADTPEIV